MYQLLYIGLGAIIFIIIVTLYNLFIGNSKDKDKNKNKKKKETKK